MRARGLTQLLFCIALAVQIVAPAADAASRFAGSLFNCSVSSEDHGKTTSSKSAPAAPGGHTADCQHCPPLAGGVPLPAVPELVAVPLAIPAFEARVADTQALLSFSILNDGAPPRAPPSRG